MKKKSIFLLALSIILLIAATANSTLAYFTTYTSAEGGYILNLKKGTTAIEAEQDGNSWFVRVTNSNDNGNQPVFVRVQFIAPRGCSLTTDGNGWTDGEDGFWYYADIVPAGGVTNYLQTAVTINPGYEPDSFDIVALYETAPVLYDANNRPTTDWTLKYGEEPCIE